jgi:antirestriction protein ArdC
LCRHAGSSAVRERGHVFCHATTLTESAGYGFNPYCKEELIAELGSAFLCGHAEIVERTIDSSAAYVGGWLKQLQNDRTLIVHAAAQAQKAADFILGNGPDNTLAGGIEKTTPAPQLAEVRV